MEGTLLRVAGARSPRCEKHASLLILCVQSTNNHTQYEESFVGVSRHHLGQCGTYHRPCM